MKPLLISRHRKQTGRMQLHEQPPLDLEVQCPIFKQLAQEWVPTVAQPGLQGGTHMLPEIKSEEFAEECSVLYRNTEVSTVAAVSCSLQNEAGRGGEAQSWAQACSFVCSAPPSTHHVLWWLQLPKSLVMPASVQGRQSITRRMKWEVILNCARFCVFWKL